MSILTVVDFLSRREMVCPHERNVTRYWSSFAVIITDKISTCKELPSFLFNFHLFFSDFVALFSGGKSKCFVFGQTLVPFT